MATPTIHLTFDQDWAPAWATAAIRNALADCDVRGTLFVTHPCPSLSRLRADQWELGWHPNYLPGSSHGSTIEEVLDTLASWVPEARGVRAHCLIQGTPYLTAYRDRGLVYEASNLRDGEACLAPFRSWTGVVEVPIFFEDDVHLERGLACTMDSLNLKHDGLKVLTFHPVLVALNACNLENYRALKTELGKRGKSLVDAGKEDFGMHRQNKAPGLADLLTELLSAHRRGELRIAGPLVDAVIDWA